MITIVTLTTLASLIPLAIGTGTDDLFDAIALATAGGTVSGTLGAMLLLPPIILLLSPRQQATGAGFDPPLPPVEKSREPIS